VADELIFLLSFVLAIVAVILVFLILKNRRKPRSVSDKIKEDLELAEKGLI